MCNSPWVVIYMVTLCAIVPVEHNLYAALGRDLHITKRLLFLNVLLIPNKVMGTHMVDDRNGRTGKVRKNNNL